MFTIFKYEKLTRAVELREFIQNDMSWDSVHWKRIFF